MVQLILTIALIGMIYAQTVPSFDFNSIPSSTSAPATCVTPASLSSSKNCTSQSTTFNYCCQMTPASGTGSFCSSVPPTQFLTSMKTWTVNGTSYSVQCDVPEGQTGTPCGVVNPKTYTDCTKYSTTRNSCCMYTNSTLSISYCFWIGMYMPVSPVPSVQCTPPPAVTTATTTTTTTTPTTTDGNLFTYGWLQILFTIFAALF